MIRLVLPVALLMSLAPANHQLAAQTVRITPTVTSMTPRFASAGEIITISGSNLMVPGYRTEIRYQLKYGSGARLSIQPTGTSSSLQFAALAGMRPDSLQIILSDTSESFGGDRTRANTYYPLTTNLIVVPGSLNVPGDPLNIKSLTGTESAPLHLRPGALSFNGEYLVQSPSSKSTTTSSLRCSLSLMSNSSEPLVSFAGSPVTVNSAKYLPTLMDVVSVTVPTLAHNTSGYLTACGQSGRDSVPAVFALPPQVTRVEGSKNGVTFTVTDGQLLRGKDYRIYGRNLRVIRWRPEINTFTRLPVEVRVGASTPMIVADNSSDTLLFVEVSDFSSLGTGALSITHGGGTLTGPQFTILSPPAPLSVTSAITAVSEVIAGTDVDLQVMLSPTPTDFARAGKLLVSVSPSLAAAIPAPPPLAFSSNPASLKLPTNVITSTVSGTVSVRHEAGTTGATVSVTIRPPRPTALTTTADTIRNGSGVTASVQFDRPGPATVLLSSSDPSTLSVPAQVTRVGTTADFAITTVPVTAPRTVTITAALNGVTASQTVVVRPGRPVSITPSVNPVIAGYGTQLTVTFDAPVTAMPLTSSPTPASLLVRQPPYSVSGTSFGISGNAQLSLIRADTVAFSVSTPYGSATMASPLIVRPNGLRDVSAGASTLTGGTQVGLTLSLEQAARELMALTFESSDPAFVPTGSALAISSGEATKLVGLTFPTTTTTRTVSVTVQLHANNIVSSPVVSSRTLTFTVTP